MEGCPPPSAVAVAPDPAAAAAAAAAARRRSCCRWKRGLCSAAVMASLPAMCVLSFLPYSTLAFCNPPSMPTTTGPSQARRQGQGRHLLHDRSSRSSRRHSSTRAMLFAPVSGSDGRRAMSSSSSSSSGSGKISSGGCVNSGRTGSKSSRMGRRSTQCGCGACRRASGRNALLVMAAASPQQDANTSPGRKDDAIGKAGGAKQEGEEEEEKEVKVVYTPPAADERELLVREGEAAAAAAEAQAEVEMPQPRLGDVVQYPGKWPNDLYLGEVVNLQYIESRGKWIADIKPLKDIGEGQFARERSQFGRLVETEDVDKLKPVRAYFVRSTNAWRAAFGKDAEGNPKPQYISEKGYDVSDFQLPQKEVDASVLETDLQAYTSLKQRIFGDTLRFGGLCTAAATVYGVLNGHGVMDGAACGLGVAAALVYVSLLGASTDTAGTKDSNKLFYFGRISLPLALCGTLVVLNVSLGEAGLGLVSAPPLSNSVTFNLIPASQFVSAMFGFVLSYRVPLLYQELNNARVTEEELLDLLPGSAGAGKRLAKGAGVNSAVKGMQSTGEAEGGGRQRGAKAAALDQYEEEMEDVTPVVVVSGPVGMGTTTLVQQVLNMDGGLPRLKASDKQDKKDSPGGRRRPPATPRWCTSRPSPEGDGTPGGLGRPEDLVFLPPAEFEDIERTGGFLQVQQGEDGFLYGLRVEEIEEVWKSGAVPVIDAKRSLVERLMREPDLALVGVWVSLDSLQAIEDRLRDNLVKQGTLGQAGDAQLEEEVEARKQEALSGIEFGVNSGVFELMVMNKDSEEDRAAGIKKIRRAIEFAYSS